MSKAIWRAQLRRRMRRVLKNVSLDVGAGRGLSGKRTGRAGYGSTMSGVRFPNHSDTNVIREHDIQVWKTI